jgi:hypothetical protein
LARISLTQDVMNRLSILAALSLALAACAPELPTTPDPVDAGDIQVADGSPEASAAIALLNDGATDVAFLDETVGLDHRAAVGLIAHRDGADAIPGTADDDAFDDIAEIDAVPYVGPVAMATLTAYSEIQGYAAFQAGSWEGIAFDPAQVQVTLDLVAHADKETLDVDAALDSRAAQAIVTARPHTMTALAQVEYVGPSAMTKIRAFLPAWQERGTALEVYDGVAFSHVEAARALAAANQAAPAALASAGVATTQASAIGAGRPWASLAAVASKPGIGPVTVTRLKTLGASFPDAVPYSVTAADAQSFSASAIDSLHDDEGFVADLDALLADETADTAWSDSILAGALAKMEADVSAYSLLEIGRTYSSADAAHEDFSGYARGLKTTAKTDYPAGLLHYVPHATQAQQLARAKIAMVHYFQYTLVNSPEWISNISGIPWSQVAAQVTAEAADFEHQSEYEAIPQYQGIDQTIFVGSLYQLHTEVTVDPIGKCTNILIEID